MEQILQIHLQMDPDSGSGEVVDDNDFSGTSDTDLDSSETEDTGSDGTNDTVEIN